jgi:hypothetical protein
MREKKFFVGILKVNIKIAGSGAGSISQRPDPRIWIRNKCHGSATPVSGQGYRYLLYGKETI